MANDNLEAAQMAFSGMEQVLGIYADAFLLAQKEDMFSLYFFQTQLPESFIGVLKQTKRIEAPQAKCISRIMLSPQGSKKLFEALAQNLGVRIEYLEQQSEAE